MRDLSRTISSPGSANDLIELINSFPPLTRVALDDQNVNGADAPRGVPRHDHRAARRRADDRLRPPVHARLRRLARRLLDHRRLRRARAATRGPGSTCPSCSTGPTRRPASSGAAQGRTTRPRSRRQQRLVGRRGGRARLRPEPEGGGPVKRAVRDRGGGRRLRRGGARARRVGRRRRRQDLRDRARQRLRPDPGRRLQDRRRARRRDRRRPPRGPGPSAGRRRGRT